MDYLMRNKMLPQEKDTLKSEVDSNYGIKLWEY